MHPHGRGSVLRRQLTPHADPSSVGKKALEICEIWGNADTELSDRVLTIQSCWVRTQFQVDFLVGFQPTVPAELWELFQRLLAQLSSQLTRAVDALSLVSQEPAPIISVFLASESRAKKARLVTRKKALDRLIDDTEKWQSRFDKVWFLILTTNLAASNAGAVDKGLGALAKGFAVGPENISTGVLPVKRVPSGVRKPFSLATSLRKALSLDRSPPPPSVFLPFVAMEMTDIPYSVAEVARRVPAKAGGGGVGGNAAAQYIVDTLECGPLVNVRDLSRKVSKLAAKLSGADPAVFGLLSCKGVMRIPHRQTTPAPAAGKNQASPPPRGFQLVFRFPDGIEVVESLRQQLLGIPAADVQPGERIRVARELAKSVGYVQGFGFVHKGIRPESVLSFRTTPGSEGRRHTCLVGFDDFRAANGVTRKIGDDLWETNLYRHPERQGHLPAEKYSMRHDIYSLGVCLLEVGLWESFVQYETREEGTEEPSQSRERGLRGAFSKWLLRGDAGVGARAVSVAAKGQGNYKWKLKDYLIDEARTRLSERMGNEYAQVVVECLSCLDESSWFRRDSTETEVAIRFMRDITMYLDDMPV